VLIVLKNFGFSRAETSIDLVVTGLIISRPLCENLKFEKLSSYIIFFNLKSLSLLSVGLLSFLNS